MATKSDVAWTIISAALTLAETRGWQSLSLAEIAAESGQAIGRIAGEFPTKDSILIAFNRRIDAKTLEEPVDSDGSVRDRLFELIMRRLDAMAPHRTAIRAILRDSVGDPLAALSGLCAVHRSMSLTLEAAGVSATGALGRLRAKALGALYLSTLYIWLRSDDAGNERIMAELDKSLARAERLATSFGRHARPGPVRAPDSKEADSETTR